MMLRSLLATHHDLLVLSYKWSGKYRSSKLDLFFFKKKKSPADLSLNHFFQRLLPNIFQCPSYCFGVHEMNLEELEGGKVKRPEDKVCFLGNSVETRRNSESESSVKCQCTLVLLFLSTFFFFFFFFF